MEVEVVTNGLRVVRFETFDKRIQYRCGVIRNEISVSETLEIGSQSCGNSGFNSSVSGGDFGYPRLISGVFPTVTVVKGLGSAKREDVLMLEGGLRSRFDDKQRANPSLITESFAKGQ